MSGTDIERPTADVGEVGSQKTPLMDRNPRLAAWVFAIYLVVGFFVVIFVVGNERWFLGDEWTFLAGRDTGNLGDYFEPLNGHWVTLPLVVWRGLFEVFGLHTYVPYQVALVTAHLTSAALLRVVMRRVGVGPWMATVVASTFVLLGAGEGNIVWAFQLTLVGSLMFGLGHLILADHGGPIGRRDYVGLGLGLAALMCSGVGLMMVVVVGLATAIRRGWRAAAFHTVPLGVVYGVWYLLVSPPSVDAGVEYSASERVTNSAGFFWAGATGTIEAVGQSTVVGFVLGVLLVVGLWVAWRPLGLRRFRDQASMPAALLAGAVLFLAMTTITAADRGLLIGSQEARADRYLHILVAMTLPALAVAAEAVTRRWRLSTPVVVLALLVGIPGNISTFEQTIFAGPYFAGQQRLVFGIGRTEEAALVPPSVLPEPIFTPNVTVGWLREIDRDGKLPDAFEPDGTTEQQWPIILGVTSRPGEAPASLRCQRRGGAFDLLTERGQEIAVPDGHADIVLLDDGIPVSEPVRYRDVGPLVLTINLDDLELRFRGTFERPEFTICT